MAEKQTSPVERADAPAAPEQHDRSGRAGGSPYVPGGRDEQGRVVPSVPREGFLSRLGTSMLAGQSVVLAVVAVWGLLASTTWSGREPTRVLGLGMNLAHATLLGAVALLGAAAATVASRRWARMWAVLQFAGFLVLFLVGVTLSVNVPDRSGLNLNGPDHILHAALALLGFVVAMLLSARIIEPPPAPARNPS